jgi:glycosyltransferase involved in cell wall biosynthesis
LASDNISIVVPCYNEEEVIGETASRLLSLMDRLATAGKIGSNSNILFVDDGSRDRTWQLIEALSRAHPRVQGVKLSRNRGHQNALMAGLFSADGDAVVSIDADLQDDINVIEQMVDDYHTGVDVVLGVRKKRDTDSFFKRTTAHAFYRVMGWLGAESVNNHADFRLLSRRAVEALSQFREANLFLRGIVPLLGFRTSIVHFDRSERFAGESKYPLHKMIAFALEGITSFSVTPLRLITLTGFVVFAFTVAMTAWVLWVRIFTAQAVPGWASTVLPLYFVGGVQILCLGVIGEYLGKIYTEVKARPRYIIDQFAGAPAKRREVPARALPTETLTSEAAPRHADIATALRNGC